MLQKPIFGRTHTYTHAHTLPRSNLIVYQSLDKLKLSWKTWGSCQVHSIHSVPFWHQTVHSTVLARIGRERKHSNWISLQHLRWITVRFKINYQVLVLDTWQVWSFDLQAKKTSSNIQDSLESYTPKRTLSDSPPPCLWTWAEIRKKYCTILIF